MRIRDERAGDASRISETHYQAFKGHPVHPPGSEPVEHLIVERLRASHALTLSLVAEIEGGVAGHVALSPAVVGGRQHGWLLLGPVGVWPPLQSRGIGSALVRAAVERWRGMGGTGIVLVGDPGFYARFGFGSVPGLAHQGVPDQYILAAWFNGPPPSGEILADEAFHISPA